MADSLTGEAATGARRSPFDIAIWIAAFLPLLHAILTWDADGQLSAQAHFLRHHSLAVVGGELSVIWIAARNGLDLKSLFADMSATLRTLLAIWLVFAFMSALLDPDRRLLSFLMTSRFVLHGLFLAAMLSLVRQQTADPVVAVVKALAAGAVAYIAVLATFILLIPDPANFPWVLRLPSATNVRQIGNVVGILAIAPTAMLLLGKGNRPALFSLLVLLVTFIAWSGTRGAVLGLITGCAVGVAATLKEVKMRNAAVALAALASGIALSVSLPRPTSNFGLVRIVSAMSPDRDISAGRTKMWNDTISEIPKAPLIGFGSGRYRDNMSAHNGLHYNHPHNVALQFVYDWGVIGGGAALGVILLLGIVLWQRTNIRPETRFLALAAFACIVSIGMIEGTLYHALPIVLGTLMIVPAMRNNIGDGIPRS